MHCKGRSSSSKSSIIVHYRAVGLFLARDDYIGISYTCAEAVVNEVFNNTHATGLPFVIDGTPVRRCRVLAPIADLIVLNLPTSVDAADHDVC